MSWQVRYRNGVGEEQRFADLTEEGAARVAAGLTSREPLYASAYVLLLAGGRRVRVWRAAERPGASPTALLGRFEWREDPDVV